MVTISTKSLEESRKQSNIFCRPVYSHVKSLPCLDDMVANLSSVYGISANFYHHVHIELVFFASHMKHSIRLEHVI